MKSAEEEGWGSWVPKSEVLHRNICWSDRSEETEEKIMAVWRE